MQIKPIMRSISEGNNVAFYIHPIDSRLSVKIMEFFYLIAVFLSLESCILLVYIFSNVNKLAIPHVQPNIKLGKYLKGVQRMSVHSRLQRHSFTLH